MMSSSWKPPSDKQIVARARAWRIFRLRGLHAQAHMLTGNCQAIALAAIDAELEKLGAQSERERQDNLRKQWES